VEVPKHKGCRGSRSCFISRSEQFSHCLFRLDIQLRRLQLADADLHQSAPAEAEHVDPDDSDEQGAEAEAEAGRLAEAERKRTEEEHKKLEAESRARRVAAAAEAENKRRREHKAANRQPASTVEESKPESSSYVLCTIVYRTVGDLPHYQFPNTCPEAIECLAPDSQPRIIGGET
jgi:hypothetical protein